MALELHALTFDSPDPERLAAFWAPMLGREPVADAREDAVLLPTTAAPGFAIRFRRSDEPRRGRNQCHVDLTSATSEAQQATVGRALDLGAGHCDVGQLPEEGHVVLADPDGNEFCVIEAGNGFLADTDLIGCLASDGTRALGLFWSAALGWPLVWDEGEETAIQAPQGGSKISWGGPPLQPQHGKARLHLDVVADDVETEVRRLLGLGASHVDIGQGDVPWAVLTDPDGNELCVLPR